MNNIWPSLKTIAKETTYKTTTAKQNVEKALNRIKELDEKYNSIISTLDDRAYARAEEIDKQIAENGAAGKLAGVPFIAKDNYLIFGGETTAASNMLKGFRAPYQSTVINKLEAEGAICVAKANLDAFAHGGSTENSDFGVTKNPYDTSRVAGGSSGGSAASVALELAPFSLGSDTGGSIRQPASFCGVVGYKPTYGLASRNGVVAMASSTDVMGPLAQTTEDAALIMEIISGKDTLDGTTIERDENNYADKSFQDLSGKKIGLIKEYLGDGVDPEVLKLVNDAVELLKAQGATVEEVSLPSLPLALAVYYVVVPAELSSNLSRHDGQRYQHSTDDATNLDESYELSRSEGFGKEAKRRIMIGTHVLSSGYYDAYYKKAQTVRTKIIQEFKEAFSNYHFLVSPVTPNVAFRIGELNTNPLEMYMQDIMTVGTSLAGVPAISVPCGAINDLPVGLQIIADQNKDRDLLTIARLYEEAKSMTPETIVAILGGIIALLGVGYIVLRKVPKKIKRVHFTRKWRELQRMCRDKSNWDNVVLDADGLLDEALKKRKKPGKSMGERLVNTQKEFTNNDAVWQAHKLAKKINQEESFTPNEKQVKDSLVAFRQALRDLGAL